MTNEPKSSGNFQYLIGNSLPKVSDAIFSSSLARMTRADLIKEIHEMRDLLALSNAKLVSVLEISSIIRKTLDYDELLVDMIERICRLMRAERSTLFIIDDDGEYITSQVLLGEENRQIRLKLGDGIAGWVAKSGETINSVNVYADPRFNANFDEETGFETHSMMCAPVRNHIGDIIGAVQVLNSKTGTFSDEDEDLLTAISCQAGIVIENQRLYQSVLESNRHLADAKQRLEQRVLELNLLYDIEHHLARTSNLNTMLRVFTQKTALILNAECAAVSLVVGGKVRLYTSTQLNDSWSFQVKVFRGEEPVLAKHLTQLFEGMELHTGSYYFDQDRVQRYRRAGRMDFLQGYDARIRNMVCIPLFDDEQHIISVVVAMNCLERRDFSDSDTRLLNLIASRVSGVILARRRAEELANSERLATIGGMLAGVVHDLKNPITVISGYIQLMERSNDPAVRKKYKKQSLQQLHQLTQMTKELLIFAKGESSVERSLVDLKAHFADLKDVLTQELASRNITLDVDLRYDASARLDPNKLNRVLLNLVRNAADAMGESGNVKICVYREGGDIVFSVSDNGNGIPEDVRDTLFDSFVTSGKKHGTGLGLAIVKNIVDLHGGKISFETETGKGTTFFVKIPLRTGNSTTPPF